MRMPYEASRARSNRATTSGAYRSKPTPPFLLLCQQGSPQILVIGKPGLHYFDGPGSQQLERSSQPR